MANKLWDDVRKSLQDIGNVAAEKGKVFSRAAADKAEELTRTGKIKLDILQVNRDIERNFTELGGKVYHLKSEDKLDTVADAPDIQMLFDKITVLEEKKSALEDKLAHVAPEEAAATEPSQAEEPATEASPEPEEGDDSDKETPA
ncbi:MAG: hypothetical protein K9N46_04060 [Candidatus Marinimicrobia bacterium]|nr:hypothetical protein [Candidatus Neomarinimicrobiota bacterium]MCF7828937.1 hypothetical protein [Candidatus Neomarinimicrobiota bacterium]MCF7879897.1 hypothetical protein [Candidatus Neomarinimicrobiota bacterium]